MAKRRKKSKKKAPMRPGSCRIFTRKNGSKGKVCKLKNGKVRFKRI